MEQLDELWGISVLSEIQEKTLPRGKRSMESGDDIWASIVLISRETTLGLPNERDNLTIFSHLCLQAKNKSKE